MPAAASALIQAPAMALNPLGRRMLLGGGLFYAWPAMSRVARLYRRSAVRKTRVVAVVGSFGKTTTTQACLQAFGLSDPFQPGGNNMAWMPFNVLAIKPGSAHAVLEVGIDRPGQMEGFARIVQPDVTVVTGIGLEHRRALGSLETTVSEKGAMVRRLRGGGVAALNHDDANVMRMARYAPGRVVTYGFSEGSDVRALSWNIESGQSAVMELDVAGRRMTLRASLVGRPQAYALLAAVATAYIEGLDLEMVSERLEGLTAADARLALHRRPDGAVVLDDSFKATPETMAGALETLRQIPGRRKIVVLGDMNETPDQPRPLYREMGAAVARVADAAVFFGGGRKSYRSGAVAEGMPADRVAVTNGDFAEVAAAAEALIEPGDVVLVKGGYTNSRMQRIALQLAGREVRCRVTRCTARALPCGRCPMLERGWDGRTTFV